MQHFQIEIPLLKLKFIYMNYIDSFINNNEVFLLNHIFVILTCDSFDKFINRSFVIPTFKRSRLGILVCFVEKIDLKYIFYFHDTSVCNLYQIQ